MRFLMQQECESQTAKKMAIGQRDCWLSKLVVLIRDGLYTSVSCSSIDIEEQTSFSGMNAEAIECRTTRLTAGLS